MKTRQLYEKILHNWPAKIICFIAALFLYAFYQISSLDKKSYTVPLNIIAEGSLVPAGNYPRRVKVTLRGKPEDIVHFDASDIKAALDISYYPKKGTYTVPVTLTLSDALMLADPLEVHVTPDTVSLTVENNYYAYKNLEPVLDGTPLHGYEIGNITVRPPSVKVSGPESMVKNLAPLQTLKISVDGKSSSFSQKTDAVIENKFITMHEATAPEVFVTIEPIFQTMKYKNIPVIPERLAAEFHVQEEPLLGLLTVTGPQLDMEKYTPQAGTVTVDCSSVTEPGIYTLPLLYHIPGTLKLENRETDSIEVSIVRNLSEDEAESNIQHSEQESNLKPTEGGR